MTRKAGSPTLTLTIGQEEWDRAVRSNSGACVVADAIKTQYPQFTHVAVDTVTIRVSDKKKGSRYIYMTPEPAQLMLHSFDQGWNKPPFEKLIIKKAAQIVPVTGRVTTPTTAESRRLRILDLETKETAGTLTGTERAALTRLRSTKRVNRPTSNGPTEVTGASGSHQPTVHGGRTIPTGPDYPKLLRGHNRHFGAKMSDPGIAFKEAVAQAVKEKLRDMGEQE